MSSEGDEPPPIVWELIPEPQMSCIRVVLPDRASVVLVRNLFQRVGEVGVVVDLASEWRMQLRNLQSIELRRSEHRSHKTVSREEDSRYVWSCTRDQWFTNAALLEPFRRGETGHQYLTDKPDDALIEISFGE